MPLLAQVYCPPEGGENDRTVYVWGCARAKCQKRDGSVRAFRASVRNEEYVRDVEEKRAAAEKQAAEDRERARKNPFTLGEGQPNGSSLFGNAQPLFGAAASTTLPNPFASTTPSAPVTEAPDMSGLSISAASSSTLAPPLPAYQPAQYLTTIEEYIPPVEDMEIESDSDEDDEDAAAQAAEFQDEAFEKMFPKAVDEVFESFVRRLGGADGGAKQVLRYELGGMPLPYSSTSPLCRKLFPGVQKPIGKDEELDIEALYDPSSVPVCAQCGSQRTFELQLVPSLISVLRPNTLTTTGEAPKASKGETKSEEERKKELARLAAGAKGDDASAAEEEAEMEWGTVMIFGCEKDCVGITEEWVGVEWEAGIDA